MGRPPLAGRGGGGGDEIQAFRPDRARLAAAVAALVVFAALVAYPPLASHRLPWIDGTLAVAAWSVLALGLAVRRPWPLAWGLALYGAEYAVFLRLRGGVVDTRAIFVAGLVAVVAELAFASIAPIRGLASRRVLGRLAAIRAIAIVASAAVAAAVLVATGSASSGVGVEAVAVVAATLAVAAVVLSGSRAR